MADSGTLRNDAMRLNAVLNLVADVAVVYNNAIRFYVFNQDIAVNVGIRRRKIEGIEAELGGSVDGFCANTPTLAIPIPLIVVLRDDENAASLMTESADVAPLRAALRLTQP